MLPAISLPDSMRLSQRFSCHRTNTHQHDMRQSSEFHQYTYRQSADHQPNPKGHGAQQRTKTRGVHARRSSSHDPVTKLTVRTLFLCHPVPPLCPSVVRREWWFPHHNTPQLSASSGEQLKTSHPLSVLPSPHAAVGYRQRRRDLVGVPVDLPIDPLCARRPSAPPARARRRGRSQLPL